MYSTTDKMVARRLYVESGYTYADVAIATGVSLGQLKAWGKAGRWLDARKTLVDASLAGDSESVYRQKAEADKVVRLLASINRRRNAAAPENASELTPDDVTRKRLAVGLSQRDLAARLGIHEKSISKLEQGRTRISKLMTIAIEAVLSSTNPGQTSNAV